MPFILILAGLLLFITAYQNTVAEFGAQIKSDLVGDTGFIVWVVALFIIGAIGYIPALRGVSRVFMALVLIVIVLSNNGVFTTLSNVITGGGGETTTPEQTPDAAEEKEP